MQTKTKTFTTESAYGKSLPSPITFPATWSIFETDAELLAAPGGPMSPKEQRQARNAKAKATAVAAARVAALAAAGYEKPNDENDPQFRLRTAYKALMSDKSRNLTEEQGRQMASAFVGVEWEDDDDE